MDPDPIILPITHRTRIVERDLTGCQVVDGRTVQYWPSLTWGEAMRATGRDVTVTVRAWAPIPDHWTAPAQPDGITPRAAVSASHTQPAVMWALELAGDSPLIGTSAQGGALLNLVHNVQVAVGFYGHWLASAEVA